MRNLPRHLLLVLLATIGTALVACGSETTTTSTDAPSTTGLPDTAPDDDVILQVEDLSTPISEQNLAEARHILDAARERWNSFDPFAHTLTLGFDGMSQLEIDIDATGNEVAERVVLGEPDDWTVTSIPRSIDDLFDEIDALIATFESGERTVPADGECGNHFHARFDTDWGAPTYYDTLGPCDDGVGLRVAIAVIE